MNCRRINSLLSAYMDGELTGREMGDVRNHLDVCHSCQNEHEALRTTKRMVASLALKVPREELESLLIAQGRKHEAVRTESPVYLRMAAWLLGTHPITLQTGADGLKTAMPFLRPRPLAATAMLSLAGFWAASASLDSSAFRDGASATAGNWVVTGVAYGGEVPQAMGSSSDASNGTFAASMSSGFRPASVGASTARAVVSAGTARAALAAWLAPRPSDSDAPSSDAAVSLPLAASGNGASAWGTTRTQNGSFSPVSTSAFLPSGSGNNSGFVPVSFNGVRH